MLCSGVKFERSTTNARLLIHLISNVLKEYGKIKLLWLNFEWVWSNEVQSRMGIHGPMSNGGEG